MKRTNTFIVNIPLFAAAVLLAGCGFQLRGELDLPENIRTVQVMAPQALRNDILALLESGSVDASTSSADADVNITVTSENFTRRVLSVDATTGKEREFQLAYTVAFGVTQRDGKPVIENDTVSLLRNYDFDTQAVIGTSREEDLLRDEMRRDAAQQLMRRVEAALKP